MSKASSIVVRDSINIPITKEQLLLLYSTGNSMFEIANQMQCSVHKIVYWMDKYNIPRRSFSEASYLKANPRGDPFKIKTASTVNEQILYGLGLGIYWGEGEKVSKGKVRVANTDINLILTFREFLTTICQVNTEKIHYSIICFSDTNPKEVVQYWSEMLEISEEKFGKIVQIPTQGKGTYQKKIKIWGLYN